MARLLLAFVVFALAIAVLKMVILALVIAGLIFRTKITVALLLLGGFLTLLDRQPLLALGLLAGFVVVARVATAKERRRLPALPPPPD